MLWRKITLCVCVARFAEWLKEPNSTVVHNARYDHLELLFFSHQAIGHEWAKICCCLTGIYWLMLISIYRYFCVFFWHSSVAKREVLFHLLSQKFFLQILTKPKWKRRRSVILSHWIFHSGLFWSIMLFFLYVIKVGTSHVAISEPSFSPFFLASAGIVGCGCTCIWSEEKRIWGQCLVSSTAVGV